MVRDGARLPVRFSFRSIESGFTGDFTSETQRVLEYPLDEVVWSPPNLRWKLGGSIAFEGTVSNDTISGTFLDGKHEGTVSLRLGEPPAPPYVRTDVVFRNGPISLSGTLLKPRTPGLHPGVVFVHGSGPESRWGASLFLADRFARAGVAALVFDKRGVGKSTGDWKTADFGNLSDDYSAAVSFLGQQPGVHARQVGIYGHSQGATIAPLIASRSTDLAFIIAAAAIGTGPVYGQDLYRVRNELVDKGLAESEVDAAMKFYGLWLEALRTGREMARYEEELPRARTEKWFAGLGIPPQNHWIWKWYPPIGNLNPLPLWEKVKVPVLLVYGEKDRNTPVGPSILGISAALSVAENTDFTSIILPRASHNLTIQWEPGKPFFWWHNSPGYGDLIVGWVKLRF